VCADLARLAGRVVLPADDDDPEAGPPVQAPSLARWRGVAVAGRGRGRSARPDRRTLSPAPFELEQSLARGLQARGGRVAVDETRLGADLTRPSAASRARLAAVAA
jgi:hypothetical protein